MSTGKKPIRKRKQPSPSPIITGSISQRLEKLRGGQRNLWGDDDDEHEPYVQSKITTNNKTYIVLTDSDDEKTSSHRRLKISKSKKKTSRIYDENLSSDNDYKVSSKCATCLICSILSTLTSHNCCSKHLSLLIHNKNSRHNHQKQTTNDDQWPPQQVMIVPMTDELIQRYLNSQDVYRLKTQNSTGTTSTESTKSTRKITKNSRRISEPSDTEHRIVKKSKPSNKSSQNDSEQASSSSITVDPILPNSGTIPGDTTFTVITSSSTTINSFESPNLLDTCQLQNSSDQPIIIIDDSQPDTQQENVSNDNSTHQNKQTDPWTPISDETYAAIEIAIDQSSQNQTEFAPAVARRTPTDLMASRLPKIRLKKGRYRQGKPIADKDTSDTSTNECQSMTISQSSSSSSTSSTSTSIIITNTRPPAALQTIVEDESLIIQSTHQISDKSSQSCHVLSQRHENITEGLSDTVMSCLFAQDESSQQDNIHSTTKTVTHETLPPPTIIVEDCSNENENNKSVDMSQSSQLTNDQNDTQPLIPSATNEKTSTITTPTRISYRTNPDGSRVSISRPGLQRSRPSLLSSLRRASVDVALLTSQTNK